MALTDQQVFILNRITGYGYNNPKWKLNPDTGLVDVNGDVSWYVYSRSSCIKDFQGIRFGRITGSFSCLNCDKLISLEGSPVRVLGYYRLANCHSLRSLEGITQYIRGNLWVENCKLINSLKGIGKVGGKIYTGGTPLIEGWDDMTQEEKEAVRSSESINIL